LEKALLIGALIIVAILISPFISPFFEDINTPEKELRIGKTSEEKKPEGAIFYENTTDVDKIDQYIDLYNKIDSTNEKIKIDNKKSEKLGDELDVNFIVSYPQDGYGKYGLNVWFKEEGTFVSTSLSDEIDSLIKLNEEKENKLIKFINSAWEDEDII